MGSSIPGRAFFKFLADPGVESHAARPDPPLSIPGAVRIALLVAISYYAGAKIGFLFKPAEMPISTFWPPNAILLAALLLTPRRMWWALILAVLPAHLLVELPAGVSIVRALGWFVGNTGEALLGAICIGYFRKQERLFGSVRGLAIFLIFGVVVAPLTTSFLDAAVVHLTGRNGPDYWMLWLTRLFSNMIANLTVVPTVFFFLRNGKSWLRQATLARWLEACVLAVGVFFVSVFVFNRIPAPAHYGSTLIFLAPLLFLLWASVRFDSGTLSACMLVVSIIASWNAVHGRGLLPAASIIESVLYLHVLLILFALPTMALSAVIADRRRAEEAAKIARNQMIQSQEQERHRIARELHNDLAQQLTLLGIEIDHLKKDLGPALWLRLQILHDQLAGISNATRDLSHELYPFSLEYLGLAAALRTLHRRANARGKMKVTFSDQNVPARLDPIISLCLYRVAQEALQNVTNQSEVCAVTVELKVENGHVWLLIIDDGAGLSREQLHSGSIGLGSARERVMELNGTFKITSAPQAGTKIEAAVPLPAA
jgi:signal transduction histidine kinase